MYSKHNNMLSKYYTVRITKKGILVKKIVLIVIKLYIYIYMQIHNSLQCHI